MLNCIPTFFPLSFWKVTCRALHQIWRSIKYAILTINHATGPACGITGLSNRLVHKFSVRLIMNSTL